MIMRWLPLAALILVQIAYPLVDGPARAALVMATVLLGVTVSLVHAVATRGGRVTAGVVAVTAGGGLLVEALGVATGFPFGRYAYTAALGPRWLGVPLVIPLAWTWMAWPSWIVAGHLVRRPAARVGVGALALASWDLFLDPQMVAAGYWHWSTVDVPVRNYVAWFAVALAMMAALLATVGPRRTAPAVDAPVLVMYLWTYVSSVLAHAVFLGLPWSALAGGIGMGLVAIPLSIRVARR